MRYRGLVVVAKFRTVIWSWLWKETNLSGIETPKKSHEIIFSLNRHETTSFYRFVNRLIRMFREHTHTHTFSNSKQWVLRGAMKYLQHYFVLCIECFFVVVAFDCFLFNLVINGKQNGIFSYRVICRLLFLYWRVEGENAPDETVLLLILQENERMFSLFLSVSASILAEVCSIFTK